jgi:hypothetical protein
VALKHVLRPKITRVARNSPQSKQKARNRGPSAEGEGFEPSVQGLPAQRFSRSPRSGLDLACASHFTAIQCRRGAVFGAVSRKTRSARRDDWSSGRVDRVHHGPTNHRMGGLRSPAKLDARMTPPVPDVVTAPPRVPTPCRRDRARGGPLSAAAPTRASTHRPSHWPPPPRGAARPSSP